MVQKNVKSTIISVSPNPSQQLPIRIKFAIVPKE
jgi:hypothetical protein